MGQIDITRISGIKSVALNHLLQESWSQNFRFVERLIRDCRSGLNCFDNPGEMLLTASLQGAVVGIAGLNRDPYFNEPKIGRLRHFYVESVGRGQGIGRLSVNQLKRFAVRTLVLYPIDFSPKASFEQASCLFNNNYGRGLTDWAVFSVCISEGFAFKIYRIIDIIEVQMLPLLRKCGYI